MKATCPQCQKAFNLGARVGTKLGAIVGAAIAGKVSKRWLGALLGGALGAGVGRLADTYVLPKCDICQVALKVADAAT
jgi:uncharacterized membrane protein